MITMLKTYKNLVLMFALGLSFLFILQLISAEVQSLPAVQKGNCTILKQTCANCTFNNISSVTIYQTGLQLLNQVAMTKIGTEYNYTFCNTNITSRYVVNGFGDPDGTFKVWAYDFEVNNLGVEQNQSRTEAISRSIYVMFGISVLLFIAFLFTSKLPVKWTFFIISLIFFLIALNILTISLSDEVANPRLVSFFDSFTAISFYMYWFAGGLLALMWGLTFFNTMFYNKNQEQMRKYG